MARTEEQNQRMRDERREQILSAAVRLFATKGLVATKVAEIAQTVGMAQGLLYHYFPSKEDIFVEIVRRAFERMNAAARSLEAAPLPPHEKLARAVVEVLHGVAASEDFAWTSVLVSAASISDAVPAEVREIIARERDVPYQVVARIVRAGQAEGRVRPGRPEDLALLFWTAVKGLALHRTALGAAYEPPDPRLLARIFFEDQEA